MVDGLNIFSKEKLDLDKLIAALEIDRKDVFFINKTEEWANIRYKLVLPPIFVLTEITFVKALININLKYFHIFPCQIFNCKPYPIIVTMHYSMCFLANF